MNRTALFVIATALVSAACASSRVTDTTVATSTIPKIATIALSPGSGPLGDAISLELFNKGYVLVEPDQTLKIVGSLNLAAFEVSTPRGLDALRDKGVEALLVVKTVEGSDNLPESATVRLISTHGSTLLAGITWQNGWGGRRGSVADRTMRRGLTEAAREIATTLLTHLR